MPHRGDKLHVDPRPPRPRQPHVTCYQRACLMLLAGHPHAISARTVQLSGRRMRVVIDEPVKLSAPVSVETGDWLGLGEVCFCRAEYGHYVVELQLDQMLIGLRELGAREQDWLSYAGQPPSFALHVGKQPLA